jgi:hypothetical protein
MDGSGPGPLAALGALEDVHESRDTGAGGAR